ncbi:heavy metal translocating P-type ATPase [Secundilactobacillus collinoides DSM 20515 = JCM 1123]|uniref:Cd(2+)-exporting ATPase n=1 Tax=Secundilactobacillus collinoides DSM 20515 = JCM 1123 TaxID=1423733 RepID=A0A0R2BD85_SECCO|nr:heavy metal translocating P-type ATPase [Secundilactobacillus collinoides DSM 20515 = JCM 1123]
MFKDKRRVTTILAAIALMIVAILLPASPLKIASFVLAYLVIGHRVLLNSVKNIGAGELFDENFLMTVATVGALLLQQYPEAVAVMLFFEIGELFEDAAISRSKNSISSLLKVKATTATVHRGCTTTVVKPEAVVPGDIIVVRAGERVPLDGELLTTSTLVDTSALTGESIPRELKRGDAILSGSINQSTTVDVRVTKRYENSTIARILDLVQNASSKKTTTERFIKRFAKIYTPVVVALAVMLAIIPPLLGLGEWLTWINRALVFLVISCPCALVISVPLSFFGGISAASRNGILVKGSNFLEVLNQVSVVAFDKTGTLTKGQFEVNQVLPAGGVSETKLTGYAAAAEQQSTHPIAQSIIRAFPIAQTDYHVTRTAETAGHGIEAVINGVTVVAGNEKALLANKIKLPQLTTSDTVVYVALDGEYAGAITVADCPKADARQAVAALNKHGSIETWMLTGDSEPVAKAIGAEIGIDNVAGGLMPEQKVAIVDRLTAEAHNKAGKVAFVGDGINDTPVLARADVGIAMGGLGSDAAIEAADVVIMDDQPSKITTAIAIAKHTKQIVWENIIFALTIKGIFLIAGALGVAGMWEAVFADVGVTLIAILNAMRLQRSASRKRH